MATSKVFLTVILGLSINMRWLNQSQMNMQAKIMRWGQVIFIPMLLLWSAALSYWISPWGMGRVGVRSTVQTMKGRLGVNKLGLFLERKNLIYCPSPWEGQASALVSGSLRWLETGSCPLVSHHSKCFWGLHCLTAFGSIWESYILHAQIARLVWFRQAKDCAHPPCRSFVPGQISPHTIAKGEKP